MNGSVNLSVSFGEMPRYAKEMRSYALQLNREMTNAYKSIENMYKVSWYGKNYNELVKQFNNMVPQMNQMLELVVYKYPVALETIANNYSENEGKGSVTVVDNTVPTKVSEMTVHTEDDMTAGYISEDVKKVQEAVSKNFTNAEEQMNNIDTEYKKIQWKGPASDEFDALFYKLKLEIINKFQSINTDFGKLMEQTRAGYSKTEDINTVQ